MEQAVKFRVACVTLVVGAVALGACKDKPAKPATPPAPPPAAAPSDAPPKAAPTLPAEAKPRGEPVTIEQATAVLPAIEGSVVLPLKQTSNKEQVHGTWCIDGSGADDVAKLVARWMGEAHFAGIGVRGDGRKAGASGDRDGLRMSMVVSASGAASCAAPKHYFASATFFRP